MYRIKENSWCCGAGGGSLMHILTSIFLPLRKGVKEAKETGAEAIVTACPWCERNLGDAINVMGDKMKLWILSNWSSKPFNRGY